MDMLTSSQFWQSLEGKKRRRFQQHDETSLTVSECFFAQKIECPKEFNSATVEVDLRLSGGHLHVLNEVLLITIPLDSEMEEIVRAHLPLYEKPRVGYAIQPVLPLLEVKTVSTLTEESSFASAELKFGVTVKEGILHTNHQLLINQLQEILKVRKVISEPEIRKVLPKDFYDVVTDSTTGKMMGHASVPGLDADLFPFQKQTVLWMLSMEGVSYVEGGETRVKREPFSEGKPVQVCLDKLSFGWEEIEIPGRYWYNRFTGNVVSEKTAILLMENLGPQPCQGLLAEEMGLGKTVETVALIRLNPRPTDQLNKQVYDYMAQRMVSQCGATLVICPETILSQWEEEVRTLCPSLKVTVYEGVYAGDEETDPVEKAHYLSQMDLVLCSYQTVSREIFRFQYNPGTRPKRRCVNTRIDYSSPLVLLQFWRVVLDEVQTVSNKVSNSAKIARIVPRFHAWGVSGTPIRKSLDDLHGVLSFLRFHPFCDFAWKKLVGNHMEFSRLWSCIALRHTKRMVHSEIKLPEQSRILLTVPFTPVEQDNYNHVFSSFLDDVGLNSVGEPAQLHWEPTPALLALMRTWLLRLRQCCCHAKLSTKRKRQDLSIEVRSVDEVLEEVLENVQNEILQQERILFLHFLRRGQLYELHKDPSSALDCWTESMEKLLRIEDKPRWWPDIIHRYYFFIGSAHYQMYHPAEADENEGLEEIPDENLTPEQLVHKEKELHFYAMAEKVRSDILNEFIRKVDQLVKSFKQITLFSHGTIPKSAGLQSMSFLEKYSLLMQQLNLQADRLNDWLTEIIRLLTIPLSGSENEDEKGKEYEQSLDQQELAFTYLEIVQMCLKDRELAIMALNDKSVLKMKVEIPTGPRSVFYDELSAIRETVIPSACHDPENSLRSLVVSSRNALEALKTAPSDKVQAKIAEREVFIFDEIHAQVEKEFEKQRKDLNRIRKHAFAPLNDIYNARIEYYRNLQAISDSVKRVDPSEYPGTLKSCLTEVDKLVLETKSRIASRISRKRYLQSLGSSQDQICIICTGPITVGSLTDCGHQYCRRCLEEWLSHRKVCPLCKKRVQRGHLYHFQYNRANLQGQMVVEPQVKHQKTDQLYEIYKPLDDETLQQIQNTSVVKRYGSKIDLIVKQIKWLKSQDPDVQVVVFSQWADLLSILSVSLKQNDISVLGSGESSKRKAGKKVKDVEIFRNDKSVTVFLLNARAQSAGLTLVNASHVFLCEPLVNTALELQAISRIHRIGQKKQTTVWMFAIEHSVEESIIKFSTQKRLELIRNIDHQADENEREIEDMVELSKNTNEMMEKKGEQGEVVRNEDVWELIFCASVKSREAPI